MRLRWGAGVGGCVGVGGAGVVLAWLWMEVNGGDPVTAALSFTRKLVTKAKLCGIPLAEFYSKLGSIGTVRLGNKLSVHAPGSRYT